MAIKTRAQLISDNNLDLPDNVTQLISPEDVRSQMNDTADSALFPEDIEDLDLSESDVTSTGNVTKTLAEWTEDIETASASITPDEFINGMTELRTITPTAGRTVHLNYHTTVGDFGAGLFYGVTTGGPYTDNDGTIIVAGGDTSKAWLRVWDKLKAHVGWFGAKCDPLNLAHDDYPAVKKCFDLFTSGRSTGGGYGGGTIVTGIIDVGPGFCFGTPLIYGGNSGSGFRLIGTISKSRGGFEKSMLRYIGPETYASIIFYGASQWHVENINTFPGLSLTGILFTADNSYNNAPAGIHTTTAPITAGSNVVVTPAFAGAGTGNAATDRVQYLQPGVMLGVGGQSAAGGAASGADFEIIYITAVDTVAGTFTADFKKDHASGSLLGGGSPSSTGWVKNCRLVCPKSLIWTTLASPMTGTTVKTFVVNDITGINIGRPIRVGSFLYAEIVYPLTIDVGAKSFTATANFSHATGEIVMAPTSGIAFGNRLMSTVQVDNVTMSDTFFHVDDIERSYAGFRQIWGGNVKAFMFNNMFAAYMRVAFAFEQASGQYMFNGGTTAGLKETIWWNNAAYLTVTGWEDESAAMWLTGLGGSNPSNATFIGCTMQGTAPDPVIVGATDEMFVYAGQLTFIGCSLRNQRIVGTTLPVITVSGINQVGSFPAGLAIINCSITNATLANYGNLVWQSPGIPSEVLKSGTSNTTMLNCIGKSTGPPERLPNIIPQSDLSKSSITSIVSPVTKTLAQWVTDRNSYQTINTNADFTLTLGTSAYFTKHTGTLTADRTVTLSTTGAVAGSSFNISRTGAGAFNLLIGAGTALVALTPNTWCEVTFDGSAWYLSAYGVLSTAIGTDSLDTLIPASGGTVTQLTSKATNVTLDKICGRITTHNASLAANTAVSFTLLSNKITAADVVHVSIASGVPDGAYDVNIDAVATGSCRISILNRTASPRTDSIVLNFAVIKGSIT